jgi:hypothetical protein
MVLKALPTQKLQVYMHFSSLKLKERVVSFFSSNDNLLYVVIAIASASLYFLYLGFIEETKTIILYSLYSVFSFLLIHLCSLGVDQFIIYNSKIKETEGEKVILPYQVLLPLLLTIVVFIMLSYFGEEVGFFNYFSISTNEKKMFITIFSVGILFGVYSKISAAILLSLGEVKKANYLFLGKAVGLFISVFSIIVFSLSGLFWLPVVLAELMGFFLVMPFVINRFKVKGFYFSKKYIFSGINIFSFDAIMKADLILLSLFDYQEFLIFYSVVSSVYEGFVQVLSSYRYQFASIIKITLDAQRLNEILKTSYVAVAGFSPAALIFSFLVLGGFEREWLMSIIILQLSLLMGVYGIITFHFFELQGRPKSLMLLAMISLVLNALVGIVLIPVVGGVGVAIGTLASFTFLSIVNYITFQQYWKKIKMVKI